MTYEQQKKLSKLNRIFADRFGRAANGNQIVRWFDVSHPALRYFICESRETVLVSPDTGLHGAQDVWVPHNRVENLGKGFIVALFKDPISEQEHRIMNGSSAPWFSEGEYVPIENTKREIHEFPDEKITIYLCKLISDMVEAGADLRGYHPKGQIIQICPHCGDEVQYLGVTCDYCGQPVETVKYKANPILESLAAQHVAAQREADRPIEDEVEDTFTAFGKVVGVRGGHVSFGGSEFKEKEALVQP